MAEEREELELWTIDDAARWLRISPAALRCRMKRGQFPRGTVVHLGRNVRFVAGRVKAWILRAAV